MEQKTIQKALQDLGATYGDQFHRTQEGERTFVRLEAVELYPGCNPSSTRMLLVFDPAQPKPQIFAQPGQLLANGKAPRSTSSVFMAGESWMQFSFNIPWSETQSIVQFIATARQRFAQDD